MVICRVVGRFIGFKSMQIKEFVKSHPLICLIIFVIFIWMIYPFLLIFTLGTKTWADLGTFGDTYGALNTLFSGLAFAVLILSLFLQRKELEAQRIELEAQRHEIKESNAIAEAQRKITEQQATLIEQQLLDSKVQAFYQLLFKYLDEKNRKVENLRSGNAHGKIVLEAFSNCILNYLKNLYLTAKDFNNADDEALNIDFNEILHDTHNRTSDSIRKGEYNEFLCFILKFIETNASLGIVEHAIEMFVSFQTIDEMHCMAYLAYDDGELTEYIKKYALLRKVNTFEDDELFLAFIERLYGADSYTPK